MACWACRATRVARQANTRRGAWRGAPMLFRGLVVLWVAHRTCNARDRVQVSAGPPDCRKNQCSSGLISRHSRARLPVLQPCATGVSGQHDCLPSSRGRFESDVALHMRCPDPSGMTPGSAVIGSPPVSVRVASRNSVTGLPALPQSVEGTRPDRVQSEFESPGRDQCLRSSAARTAVLHAARRGFESLSRYQMRYPDVFEVDR